MYICSLTLGACPAANRTYATYGSSVTADVSEHVFLRIRESEQYSTHEIAATLRHLYCLYLSFSVCLSLCRSLCLFVCLPLCLPACLLIGLSVCWSLSFYFSCPALLGSFPKEICHLSTPANSSHKSCNTRHNTYCNKLRHTVHTLLSKRYRPNRSHDPGFLTCVCVCARLCVCGICSHNV